MMKFCIVNDEVLYYKRWIYHRCDVEQQQRLQDIPEGGRDAAWVADIPRHGVAKGGSAPVFLLGEPDLVYVEAAPLPVHYVPVLGIV